MNGKQTYASYDWSDNILKEFFIKNPEEAFNMHINYVKSAVDIIEKLRLKIEYLQEQLPDEIK